MKSKNNQLPPPGGYGNQDKNIPEPVKSLTKENTWNDLYITCPKAIKLFCDWIDAYKKEIDWKVFFNHIDHTGDSIDFKFHDLPIELQIGIFIRFARENELPYYHFPVMISNFRQSVIDWFLFKESMIENNHHF